MAMEGTVASTSTHAKRAGDWKGRERIAGEGERERGLTRAATAGWFQVARTQRQGRAHFCFVSRSKRYEELFPSLSERGTSETVKGRRTHERASLGIVSTFHA
jgi:hypothetical protein